MVTVSCDPRYVLYLQAMFCICKQCNYLIRQLMKKSSNQNEHCLQIYITDDDEYHLYNKCKLISLIYSRLLIGKVYLNVIFHDLIQNQLFRKILSGILSGCQTVWI